MTIFLCSHSFQELDLSASAFLLDSSSREEDWTRMIDQGMKNRKKYRKVASKQLVGMLILVYTKVDHSNFIKEIATDAAGTGLMGMMVKRNVKRLGPIY